MEQQDGSSPVKTDEMEKDDLLELERLSSLSPKELKEANPKIFASLKARAIKRIRAPLTALFEKSPQELKELISNFDLESALEAKKGLKEALIDYLDASKLPQEVLLEARKLIQMPESSSSLSNPLNLDTPIESQPLVQKELHEAKIHLIGDLVGLLEAKKAKVISKSPSIFLINDAALKSLVDAGDLTDDEARDFGLASSLYSLADGNIDVAKILKTKTFSKLGKHRIKKIRDLAAFDSSDWLSVLQEADFKPPKGKTSETQAAMLSRKVAALYPTDAFLSRFKPREESEILKGLKRLKPLFEKNESIFAKSDFDRLNSEGLKKDKVKQLKEEHSQLKRLANSYPGLRISQLLDDPKLSPEERAGKAAERIGAFNRFRAQNQNLELLNLDYSPESKDVESLDLSQVSSEEKVMILSNLKAYQRVHSLTKDPDHSQALLAAGYSSATSIVRGGLQQFKRRCASSNGDLDPVFYKNTYSTAQDISLAAAVGLAAITDALWGGIADLDVSNLRPEAITEIKDYLMKLDGFEEFFGSQDYCKCEHCQSILSPAAYFVDMMKFVEKNVLDEYFRDRQDSAINLRNRRPDLWETVELTCENTNEKVPTLDIINEILENHIAKRLGFSGELSDRTAVEDLVYLELSDPETLTSFRQPFVLPLEKLQIYLRHFGRTRADVARLLNKPQSVVAASMLEISKQEYDIITRPVTGLDSLRQMYGIRFERPQLGTVKPSRRIITAFEAKLLLKPMGLSRDELGEFVELLSDFGGNAWNVEIVGAKKDENSVQNDKEEIRNLNTYLLDIMHRFTRLWRRVPWSMSDLFLVLSHLGDDDLSMRSSTVQKLTTALYIQKRLGLSVEASCALWSDLRQTEAAKKGSSLFNRLFNIPPFEKLDGALPPKDNPCNPKKFVHPFLSSDGATEDNTLHRLLAGMQIGDEELYQLILILSSPLDPDLTTENPQSRVEGFDLTEGFELTEHNLSLLYRHALLAKRLNLSILDLFQLIDHAKIQNGYIDSISDLSGLLKLFDWWKGSGYSLDDLGFITDGKVRDVAAYGDSEAIVDQILSEVQSEKALDFADTIFAFLEGVTEEQSRSIIGSNSGIIAPENSSYRLLNSYDPVRVPLTIPEGVTILDATTDEEKQARVKDLLAKYHASELIPVRLAAKLGLSPEKVKALIRISGKNLFGPNFTLALQGDPDCRDDLANLVDQVIRLNVLFRGPFDPEAIDFIRENPGIFSIVDFARISMDQVRKLSVYAAFADTSEKDKFSEKSPGFEPADVMIALQALHGNLLDAAGKADDIAKVLGIEGAVVKTLLRSSVRGSVSLPETAPERLEKIAQYTELARHLGIGIETLSLIVSDDYNTLAKASNAVLGGFRAKYPVEADWEEKIEPFEDKIRSAKRDALVDYLINSIYHQSEFLPEFESESDLYHHFLIDVELEGCARTSKVVAAISSVQLYVHRILMNLEQDQRDDTKHIHVKPECIPPVEWEWRKNYRVWEANRKVFLYPENYIEPGLQDNKTPLFEELESKLLQQEINEQSVLDAYAGYLSGFDEVAKLKIAGAFHEKGDNEDVLHIFGVTPGDPITYYYRTMKNLWYSELGRELWSAFYSEYRPRQGIVWSPWRKIDVQIPVRKVAPVIYFGRLYVFWVNLVTTTQNKVEGGDSKFDGYKHTLSLKYITLKPDGSWTAPQQLDLENGIVKDPLERKKGKYLQPKYDNRSVHLHLEPEDDYTLSGIDWNQIYPERSSPSFVILGLKEGRRINFYEKKAVVDNDISIYYITNTQRSIFAFSEGHLLIEISEGQPLGVTLKRNEIYSSICNQFNFGEYATRTKLLQKRYDYSIDIVDKLESIGIDRRTIVPIIKLNDPNNTEVSVINDNFRSYDSIIDIQGDIFILQNRIYSLSEQMYNLLRMSTKLADDAITSLFTCGLDELLSIDFQERQVEGEPQMILLNGLVNKECVTDELDFDGPYGIYYREIFFHIPFLIANALNSQQRFEAAQRWYHYIFNPTISESSSSDNQQDRNWRYTEFRGQGLPKLRDILQDKQSIEVYKNDPWDPHAIALTRMSAYQKCIVMKYIDNLLDWGDSLFSQFTTESVNEAILLYSVASDLLGERPAELGDCGEGKIEPKTYEKISPYLGDESEIFAEIETVQSKSYYSNANSSVIICTYALDNAFAFQGIEPSNLAYDNSAAINNAYKGTFKGDDWKKTHIKNRSGGDLNKDRSDTVRDSGMTNMTSGLILEFEMAPVFCVPANKELMEYWDRVEDRLFKIRNCMDIAGVSRELALFAPEIDPRLLVRAKAAGLSIEDVLNATSGDLPPYRFLYIIEKAKSYAAVVQSFGSALLSALEKKDVEELSRLRAVHEQNLQKLTLQTKRREIDIESEAVQALERQLDAINYRKGYYQSLVDTGLSSWERTEEAAINAASLLRLTEASLGFLAGVLHLLPQLGSPFALKYGGQETGNSSHRLAVATGTLAAICDAIAASAGLEGKFDRREEEWNHQAELADYELKQVERQKTASEIRLEIANKSLEIHQKSIEQTEEIFDLYGEKFTSFGLYTWLSTTLLRLYRDAYNSAYSMARLAEQAFRFERGDDAAVFITSGYWEASKSGLLAGERLLIDLQNLERRFIETNYRSLEIDQSFSLNQIDPYALMQLRETGECGFEIQEFFFALFYPGHYRRRIKAVRLTIPCVAGPYTNVSATLKLTGSKIRMEPDSELTSVPLRRSVSIATSKAQNDAGVFELNFHDERYMPFEGAGAVSTWELTLPKNFKQFDYQTISDVILHISYTAEENDGLRNDVESTIGDFEDSLLGFLTTKSLRQSFSLKHDFPSAFHRLTHSPINTPVNIEITDNHLPFFLNSFLKSGKIKVTEFKLMLRIAQVSDVDPFQISINSVGQSGFALENGLSDIWSINIKSRDLRGILGNHTLLIENAGTLSAESPDEIDPEKLKDIILHIEYKVDDGS
jgi:hypothetical protein